MSESPLRQQIAEAIHNVTCGCSDVQDCIGLHQEDYPAADAVVALLNLTEEVRADERFFHHTVPAARRWVSPWVNDPTANDAYWREIVQRLPTPPDTSGPPA